MVRKKAGKRRIRSREKNQKTTKKNLEPSQPKKNKKTSEKEERKEGKKEKKEKEGRKEEKKEMVSFIGSVKKMLKGEEPIKPLDRYKIIRQINHGAFSKVYEGYDRVAKREVAIKVMPKEGIKEKQITNILREINLHRTLNHDHIVQFFDFVETNDNYCLVMEMMKGGELFERIEKVEQFTEKDARNIIFQAAQAVKHLHENNIVHRDIKPENLVFSTHHLFPVKLCDFGLSKVIHQDTSTPCGTIGYLAPEVLCEQKHSFSVDIWGLGCVLYSMLCGFPAFHDESLAILTHRVKKGIYDFPSPWWDNISPSAIDLVKRCLTVDPLKRYNIYQFLNHPWIRGEALQNPRPLGSPALLRDNSKKEMFTASYELKRKEHGKELGKDLKKLPEEDEKGEGPRSLSFSAIHQSSLMAKREKRRKDIRE